MITTWVTTYKGNFRKNKSVTCDNLIHSVCVCHTFACIRNISQ